MVYLLYVSVSISITTFLVPLGQIKYLSLSLLLCLAHDYHGFSGKFFPSFFNYYTTVSSQDWIKEGVTVLNACSTQVI